MEHIIKQLKNAAKDTRLSPVEKAEIKSALLRHVKANPVRLRPGRESVDSELLSRHQSSKAYKIISPFQINNLRNKKTMPILVIMGLLMGGSASFAAENTVPGDMLYPVKVHVNESVRGTFAVTPKAKADWEVKLVERRLEEVEKLATTPSVTPEAQQSAQTNLAQYSERVKERITKFENENDSEDAMDTASNLSEMLSHHEQILTDLSVSAAGAVASNETATSTLSVFATTTADSTTAVSSAIDASIKDALLNIRGAHGDAEKRNKELKKKYHREEAPEVSNSEEESVPADFTSTPVAGEASTTVSVGAGVDVAPSAAVHSDEREKILRSIKENRQEERRNRMEELHSTPLPAIDTVATTTVNTLFPPKAETHIEVPKVNEND